jgi:DNA processing protein
VTHHIETLTPDELLGPLNGVERRHAPKELHLAGDRSLLESGRRVAIVGSRDASETGLQRARILAGTLAEQGVTVVSGLARGIDTAAHMAAIQAHGRTIAVLGTPLTACYPAENQALQTLLIAEHLVVSQFAPGIKTHRSHFPLRNRTMALLSDATVIVEAEERSGTVHQGWEALRLGRPLYLLESLASRDDLTWPKELLHYGAQVLTRVNLLEVLAELPERVRGDAAAF